MEHRASNYSALVPTHPCSSLEVTKVKAMTQTHENVIRLNSRESGDLY